MYLGTFYTYMSQQLMRKEVMNLKENKEYMGRFEGGKKRGK